MIFGRSVNSDHGGISAGRDINGPIGIQPDTVASLIEAATHDWKRLTDEQRATIDALQRQLGVGQAAIRRFLSDLGEAEVPAGLLGERLIEIAERYKQLENDIATISEDDRGVRALNRETREALEAGELDRVDALLAEVFTVQDAAVNRRQQDVAATLARRGQLALTRLRYLEAARYFGAASERVAREDEQALSYLDEAINAYYLQGDEFGDNASLTTCIERLRSSLFQRSRQRTPFAWAAVQNKLGNALQTLGRRKSGTVHLEEAVAAYQDALLEYTRDSVPLQ